MNIKTTGLAILGVLATAANANAEMLYDIYAGVGLSVGNMTLHSGDEHPHESSAAYGAMVGIDIPFLRLEGEYSYLNPKSSHSYAHLAMFNAYVKMPTELIKPYLGAGIGSVFKGQINDTYNIKNATAYQAMLGLTFEIPVLPLKFDAEGRVLYAPNAFTIANDDYDILQYDLRLKLRYIF